ncbi:MAG: hypothetical protein LBI35_01265 [Burkholderiales bacterium]|jgi:hypothetical protein|nr:hypothetical protein [Burkholderiales bacterium]
MGCVLIKISDVEARLKTIKDFKRVGIAADLATIKDLRQFVPAAYVLPASSEGTDSLYSNTSDAVIGDTFVVYIVARNVKDTRGAAATQTLEPLRIKVYDTLVGWLPPSGHSEFFYRRGKIDRFDDQCIYWRDEFSASRLCQ